MSVATPSTPRANGHSASASAVAMVQLSPTSAAKLNEKEELQHLNDRLDQVITKRRGIEQEVNHLRAENDSLKASAEKERDALAKSYETQLEKISLLLNEAKAEAAQMETLRAEVAYWKAKHSDEASTSKKLEKERNALDEKLAALSTAKAKLEEHLAHAEAESSRLAKEVATLQKDLNKAAKALAETETQLAVTLQNAASRQALDEAKIHEREQALKALHSEKKAREKELEATFAETLAAELAELGEQKDAENARTVRELEDHWEQFAHAAHTKQRLDSETISTLQQQLLEAQSLRKQAETEAAALSSKNHALEARVSRLEQDLLSERLKVEELSRQRTELNVSTEAVLAQKNRELTELIQANSSLVSEIDRYSSLLQKEEQRLGLTAASPTRAKRTASQAHASAASPLAAGSSSVKRARMDYSQTPPASSKSSSASAPALPPSSGLPKQKNLVVTSFTAHKSSRGDQASSSTSSWSSSTGAAPSSPLDQVMFDSMELRENGCSLVLRSLDVGEPLSLHKWSLVCHTPADQELVYTFGKKAVLDAGHPTLSLWLGLGGSAESSSSAAKGHSFVWNMEAEWLSSELETRFALRDATQMEVAHLRVRKQKEDELFDRKSEPAMSCLIS